MSRIKHTLIVTAVASAMSAATANATLVVHWALDETTGTTAADSAGTAQNGTVLNPAGGTPAWTTGLFGGAYAFTASSDEVIHTSVSNNSGPVITWSLWVKSAAAGGTMASLSSSTLFDNYTNLGRSSSVDNAGKPFISKRITSGTVSEPFAATPVNDGNWNHVVGTIDWNDTGDGLVQASEQTRRIYVNGILEGTYAETQGRSNTTILGIGATKRPTDVIGEINATIDDFGYWNNAIDGVDIALIHGLGRFSGVTLDDASIADVRAAWLAGDGNSAVSGSLTWNYATGLTGVTGATGGSVLGDDAFIVLDGTSGTGVSIAIPEPASLTLVAMGAMLGLRRRRN